MAQNKQKICKEYNFFKIIADSAEFWYIYNVFEVADHDSDIRFLKTKIVDINKADL